MTRERLGWREKWWAPIPVWKRSAAWRQGYYAGVIVGVQLVFQGRRLRRTAKELRALRG